MNQLQVKELVPFKIFNSSQEFVFREKSAGYYYFQRFEDSQATIEKTWLQLSSVVYSRDIIVLKKLTGCLACFNGYSIAYTYIYFNTVISMITPVQYKAYNL